MTPAEIVDIAPRGWAFHVLRERGYPIAVAIRVACTPPLTVNQPSAINDARPGLELQDALEAKFGQVVGIFMDAGLHRRLAK